MIVITERPPDGFVPAYRHCFSFFEGHPCVTGYYPEGSDIERNFLYKLPPETDSASGDILDLLADLLIETEKR